MFNVKLRKHVLGVGLGLCLLSACDSNSPGLHVESPSPQLSPTPAPGLESSASTGIEDIASAGSNQSPNTPAPTATPRPSSQVPPSALGPTAVPSSFSPQCPIGEGYTIPYPSPVATPIPAEPNLFPPPPMTPFSVTHTFTLPFELSQNRFCDPAQAEHWVIDSRGVLSHQKQGEALTRVQLTTAQINAILNLINQEQPHQMTAQFEPLYRCQAAEICPLEHSVSVGTGNGGQSGWSDRGNLIYPERYNETMAQLVEWLQQAQNENPVASSPYTYRSALSMRSFDTQEKVTGTGYVLLPGGNLTRLQNNVKDAEILLNPSQQASFQVLLQGLDPLKQYEAFFEGETPTNPLAGNTLWGFEYEHFSQLPGPYGGSIGLQQMPNTPAAESLKADLQRLIQQLEGFFRDAGQS